jgi:hypothetical protein
MMIQYLNFKESSDSEGRRNECNNLKLGFHNNESVLELKKLEQKFRSEIFQKQD